MGNQEHLEMFKQGVEVWNRWRKEHRDVNPDLSGEDFSGALLDDVRLSFSRLAETRFSDAHLQRAYFVSSNLSYANFSGANFVEGHLDSATLTRANLSGAKLQRAKIRSANLSGANLSGADLSFANLDRASLCNANLHETDLSFATIGGAELSNIDLSTAKGLDTIIHRAYSHLGIQTLARSLKCLPAAFLQGVGVPDSMLTYVHALNPRAPVYATCLLSYASQDRGFVQQLQADLQSHGVLCESAPYDVKREKVTELVREPTVIYDMQLLVTSEHVETELARHALYIIVKEGLFKERKGFTPILLPLHLGKAPEEMGGIWTRLLRMCQHQSRDFTRWRNEDFYRTAFEQLLQALL